MAHRINTSGFQNIHIREFINKLKNNHEDLKTIRAVEQLIRNRRRYIFRMPKTGGSVVLLLSGGLDSIIAWGVLLHTYRVHTYPIMIPTKWNDPQKTSVKYYSRYFKRKYPKLYHEPFITRPSVVDQMPFLHIKPHALSADTLLELYNPAFNQLDLPISGTNIFTAVTASAYCLYISRTQHIPISTIIYAATADDGLFVPSQTFAFLRLMMLMLMRLLNNDAMQFTSIFYESSLGTLYRKRDVLHYGHILGIPLKRTYSCDKRGIIHCGSCLSCISRQYCFTKNNIPDPTVYQNQIPLFSRIANVTNRIKHALMWS